MDRPGFEDRKRSPLGDRREKPILCHKCKSPTFNLNELLCDDCQEAA